jgi:hypothetical protein
VKAGDCKVLSFINRALTLLAVFAGPAAGAVQACPMCYQSAAASGPRTIHALNTGVIILMIPPALITAGIFYMAYKKRNQFDEATETV